MVKELGGKTFIVTGAGSGIGRATATELARRGASVVLADKNAQNVREAAATIDREGGIAMAVPADVSDECQVEALVQSAVEQYGRLDGAFNNAGIEMHFQRLHDLRLDDWNKVIGVNLTGIFLCMKHEIKAMLDTGGAIVNTSSVFAQIAVPAAVEYIASKSGVMGLTRAAAVEYGAQGIRVNAILPGTIQTPMVMERSMQQPGFAAALDQIKARHPIGRFGDPEEIATVVAWLLSSEASFVNGACVPVDGGFLSN